MLARTINLNGKWEVGLVEFEHPLSWYTFNEEDAAFTINNGETTVRNGEKAKRLRLSSIANRTYQIMMIKLFWSER